LLLGEFILKTNDLEALSADLAAVDRSLSYHVEYFFVGVRVVLNAGTHTNYDTPARVRGENEDGVVNGSELAVNS
jgi:hypothetical protein